MSLMVRSWFEHLLHLGSVARCESQAGQYRQRQMPISNEIKDAHMSLDGFLSIICGSHHLRRWVINYGCMPAEVRGQVAPRLGFPDCFKFQPHVVLEQIVTSLNSPRRPRQRLLIC